MHLPPPLATLGRPDAYLAQIERLRDRYGRMRRLDALTYRGLTLGDLGAAAERLSRELARAVARGEYSLGPLSPRDARVGGKVRTLFRGHLLDTVVLGVVAQVLAAMAEPALSPRVYSYRAGRSSWETLEHLREYFRAHRAAHPDVRQRGLYVLHRDVRAYGESIPTDDGSRLWAELERVVDGAGVPRDHFFWRLVRGAMRPEISLPPGAPMPRVGVPTGSPVQTIACNLYLGEVDRALEAVPGGFYARFGDDMLFCHPDPTAAQRAATVMDRIIQDLRLEVKAEKRRDYYLTGAGRASSALPGSRGTTRFDYLGFRLDLGGNVGLKTEKARRLLRELRARAAAAAAATRDDRPGAAPAPAAPGAASSPRRLRASVDVDRARTVCDAIARALDPTCPVADPAAAVLRYVITDRRELASIDHALALSVAELLSGVRGPRAFRLVPYRFLRERAGLPSLVVARNTARRPGGPA